MQRVIFPHVNQATVNVLAAEGCDVVAPADQGCCGALALHAGRLDDARAWARRTIETFDRAGIDQIVVNAAGCGSSMKEYAQLLADDPAVGGEGAGVFRPSARRHRAARRVSVHPERRVTRWRCVSPITTRVIWRTRKASASRRAICCDRFPGLELVPFAEQEICCGSAGIYNLVEPDAAQQLGDRKTSHIASVQPDVVATANPGCMLQIRAGAARQQQTWSVVHPIELLDAAIRRKGVKEG